VLVWQTRTVHGDNQVSPCSMRVYTVVRLLENGRHNICATRLTKSQIKTKRKKGQTNGKAAIRCCDILNSKRPVAYMNTTFITWWFFFWKGRNCVRQPTFQLWNKRHFCKLSPNWSARRQRRRRDSCWRCERDEDWCTSARTKDVRRSFESW